MKKILLAFAILSSVFYYSCGSDDTETGGGTSSVTITADYTTRFLNEVITFTAKDANGADVSTSAVFYVDDVAITGRTFTSTIVRTYVVKAKYNGVFSSTIIVNFDVPLTSITVAANPPSVEIGETITFTVTGNNNANLTSTSNLFVNGVQITGNSYTTTTPGTYQVYAKHTPTGGTAIISSTIQATFNNIIKFNKRVLIEDFTGTWCQFCPRVSYAIELVEAQTSDATVVAIHRGASDPFNFTGAAALESQIGLAGYPTAILNRKTEWTYPETSASSVTQAVDLTNGINPKIGVALQTATSGNTATVTAKVKFGKNFSNLKIVVYAVENGLIYNQTNSTSYYAGANPIVGFQHNHVLRAVLSSSILGEAITGNTNYNDEFSKTFTYTVPSTVNASNLQFVAFVIDANDKALNSRTVGPNENQSFEIE